MSGCLNLMNKYILDMDGIYVLAHTSRFASYQLEHEGMNERILGFNGIQNCLPSLEHE